MPSFAVDSPLDHNIKKNVINDTLRLLRLDKENNQVKIKEYEEKRMLRLQGKENEQ